MGVECPWYAPDYVHVNSTGDKANKGLLVEGKELETI